MSNPLQNDPPQLPSRDQRKDTAAKILAVADVIHELLKALLSIFGRRQGDKL